MKLFKHKKYQEPKKINKERLYNALKELDMLKNRINQMNEESDVINSIGIKNFTSCMYRDVNRIIVNLSLLENDLEVL